MNPEDYAFRPGESVEDWQKRIEGAVHNLPNVSDAVRQDIQGVFADTSMLQEAENEQASERAKVEAGIQMAVQQGIVAETVLNPTGKPTCVIVGSSHLDSTSHTPIAEGLAAQTQVFQLLYCLQESGADSNPLYCEGEPLQSSFTRLQLEEDLPGGLYSPEGQRYLFEHPDHVQELLHQIAAQRPDFANFSTLSAYHGLQGIHSPELHERLNQHLNTEVKPNMSGFFAKYPLHAAGPEISIQSGIDRRSGKPTLLINEQMFLAEDVVRDCDNYIRTVQKFDAFSAEREEETVQTLSRNHGANVPLTWCGIAHARKVAEACVARGMRVHLLYMTSDAQFFNDERVHQQVDPWLPQIVQLRDFAASLLSE
jgi:hypothetical protein